MLQKLFGFDASTMTLRKEVIGGITTFLTMAYILAVNPSILSATGMDAGAVFTTTCISAVVATLVMALYAKLPFALAPGMGLNAFFAFTVVLTMGYSWQFALTAVLIEGIIFILLTVTGLRRHIVNAIPLVMRRAISPGIGLFIAFVGLKSAGIVTSSESTFITLGDMHEPGVLLSLFGILLTAALMVRKVTGSLLIGILVTTIIGIPIGVSNRAGMVDDDGNVKNLNQAFMADAIGTTIGAMLGTSTVTTYVESASGVNVGGRSGFTSLTTAICFAIALLFAPLFLAIPAQATAAALILVGVMMMYEVRKVDFSDYVTGIPCFVCIVLMPLTYSISDGILLGVISYVLIHLLSGKLKDKDERNNINWATILLAVLFICRYAFL